MRRPSPTPDSPPPSLRASAAKGVGWTTTGMVATTVLQLVQFTILARILETDEFGLLAIMLVFLNLGTAFADIGLSFVLITRRIESPQVLASLYWANVLSGLVVGAIVFALAHPIASIYGDDRLAGLLQWTSAVFSLTALGQQFQVLLQRAMRFATLARIEIAAVSVGVAVAVGTAIAGVGPLALVLGYIALAAVRGLLLVGASGLAVPRPRMRLSELRPHLGFGAFQMGERMVNHVAADVDYLLIGRFASLEMLGAYMLAFQLVIIPSRRLAPVLAKVAFPVFAQQRSDHAVVSRGFNELLGALGLIAVPALALLAALGSTLVPVAFGDGWGLAVSVLPPLAIVGGAKVLASPAGPLFLAEDRPDLGFKLNLALLFTLTLALLGALQVGVLAAAWTYAAVATAFLVISMIMTERLIADRVVDQAKAIASGLPAAAAGVLAALLATAAVEGRVSEPVQLLIAGGLGGLLSLTVIWLSSGDYIRAQLGVMRSPP